MASYFLSPSVTSAQGSFFINEILLNGESGEEFIELYNPSDEDISLANYYLAYYSSSRDWDKPYRTKKFPDEAKIKSKSFYLITTTENELTEENPDWNLGYTSHMLSDSHGSLAIFPSDQWLKEQKVDLISWGQVNFVGKGEELEVVTNGNSLEKKTSGDWSESREPGGTPGEKNSLEIDIPDPAEDDDDLPPEEENTATGNIWINEIYPAPESEEKEFVEIINVSLEPINITGYRIEDEAKHKIIIEDKILIPGEIYAIEGSFQLNNTTSDVAFLWDKNNNLVDARPYEKPRSQYSYAFDGETWRWTKKVTPGKINEFNQKIAGEIKKDKNIYPGIYANFEVKTGGEAKKFVWDFGDDHKSYVKKTRHKYEEPGTYEATLKITGDGEENVLSFDILVLNYPKSEVEIIGIFPNPQGKDEEKEYLLLKNKSNKKVNLKNWSIATGWKKLSNHPINEDFSISGKNTKKLTNNISSFSLSNQKTKIELRDPTGKTVDKVKYDKGKKQVAENEIYEKSGKKWEWKEVPIDELELGNTEDELEDDEEEIISDLDSEEAEEAEEPAESENDRKEENSIPENALVLGEENEKKYTSATNQTVATNYGQVLGGRNKKIPSQNNYYSFTPSGKRLHWAVKITDNYKKKINLFLNELITNMN